MAAKQKTRKELLKQPDEFITLTGRAIALVRGYQNQITTIICVVVAVFLIVLGYRFFAHRAEVKAFSILQQIQSEYQILKESSTSAEAYSRISEAFEGIINKYGGNAGGRLARVIYANISYDAGQYAKAIDLYKRSLSDFKDDSVVTNLILNSLGYAYQQLNDPQNSAVYFERAAAASDSLAREEALLNLGWVYQKLGDAAKSRQTLQTLLDDYPNSIYFDMVQEELSVGKSDPAS